MYSRIRMITDLTKVKVDLREIYQAAPGTATNTTLDELRRIILALDEILAIEHNKSRGKNKC